jgi:VCBS repeat-containing protein
MAGLLSLYQGDSQVLQIPIYSSGTVPAMLSAPSGTYVIAASNQAPIVLLAKTGVFSMDSSGLWTMSVTLTAADTAALPAGRLYQQAVVGDVDGSRDTVLAAALTVLPIISDSAIVSSPGSGSSVNAFDPAGTAANLLAVSSASSAFMAALILG